MDVYVENYVSPLKYPLKRDACNDRGRLQVLSRLADFIPYRLTHARAYHARVAFDYRVRMYITFLLAGNPGNLPVRFGFRFLGY